MKKSTIFWGVLLIVIGVILLINRISAYELDLRFIFDLWPIVFVLWGISILKLPEIAKKLITAVTAILIGIFFSAIFTHGWNANFNWDFWHDNNDVSSDNTKFMSISKSIKFKHDSSMTNINLKINSGAALVNISCGDSDLVKVENFTGKSDIGVNYDSVSHDINLDLSSVGSNFFGSSKKNKKIDVFLHPLPNWNMDFDVGASTLKCDLSNLKVPKINMNVGAASVNLKLGSLQDTIILKLESGASSVKIQIPETSGCEIHSETGLSNVKMEGFTNIDGINRTENFQTSNKKIFIDIQGGVSSIKITKY